MFSYPLYLIPLQVHMLNQIIPQQKAKLIANLPMPIKQNIEDIVTYSIGQPSVTIDNIMLGFKENYPDLSSQDLEAIHDYLSYFNRMYGYSNNLCFQILKIAILVITIVFIVGVFFLLLSHLKS